MNRWYLGVDWADRAHAVWVEDEAGTKVMSRTVAHTGEGLAEFGRWLDEQRADGMELWAAIERPDGSVVDLLLDHTPYDETRHLATMARQHLRQAA